MPSSSETFDTFFTNVPAATTPLSNEPMLVLQGGTTKQVPVNGGAGNATVFYVSPTGNDTAIGTSQANPWRTIAKVNASTFQPGTAILFQGGQTFSGAIVCPSAGTASTPIIFGSYGGGRATISSGNSNGFTSTNQAGVIVRDLIFTGNSSTNVGILFNCTLGVPTRFQNIGAINCNVSGYGQWGILVNTVVANIPAGYDDILIQGCTASNCTGNSGVLTAGIMVQGNAYPLATYGANHTNVLIDNCTVSSCPGYAGASNWTGSGIVINSTQYGIVSNCEANGNGAASTTSAGPTGIWMWNAKSVTITGCRSINNTTAGGDGDGFDLDGGCSDCEINNCYSSGNAGTGYLLFCYDDGLINNNDGSRVINCVSDGDGLNLPCIEVLAQGSRNITNFTIANCTVYNKNSNPALTLSAASSTGRVINCSLSNSSTQTFISGSPAGVTLSGNIGYSASGIQFLVGNTHVFDYGLSVSNVFSVGRAIGGEIDSTYLVAAGNSGFTPGFFLQLTGGTQGGRFRLDTNNNTALEMGNSVLATDVTLNRQGVGIFGIQNITNTSPAGLQVYNTSDTLNAAPVSNYERAVFDWTSSSNLLTIGTQANGSGTPRNVSLISAGGQVSCPNGSVIAGQAPGVTFAVNSSTGFGANATNLAIWESGTIALDIATAILQIRAPSNFLFSWASGTPNNSAADAALARVTASVVEINNGTAGTGPGVILPRPTTFANLPAAPIQGMMASITDGLAGNCGDGSCTTFGTNVTGGTGALKLNLWYNGTHWTLIGK